MTNPPTTTTNTPTQIHWTANTHQGRTRPDNQDSFLILRFNQTELNYLGKQGTSPLQPYHYIFAVSDGIGGQKAGAYASKTILQTLTDQIARTHHQHNNKPPNPTPQHLTQLCQQTHQQTRRIAHHYPECQNMGATLTLAWIHQQTTHIAHLGDSRLYHLNQQGKLTQLTQDHTTPGRLQHAGKITERQARQHPNRHQLEKAIGTNQTNIQPQTLTTTHQPGDHLILCTDGITDGLWNKSIQKLIHNPPPYLQNHNPAQRLTKEALEASGRDNLTAITIHIT